MEVAVDNRQLDSDLGVMQYKIISLEIALVYSYHKQR